MDISEFLGCLKQVRKSGDGWIAECPAHEDKNPSLSISQGEDGKILVKCFAGCETSEVVKALGLGMRDLFPNEKVSSYLPIQDDQVTKFSEHIENTKDCDKKTWSSKKNHVDQVSRLGCTLEEYASYKKLPRDFIESLGITESKYKGIIRLVIAYFDEKGELVCRRFRLCLEGDKKFAWEKGARPCLYGLWRIKNYSADRIVLVEGESDCHVLWLNDIPALGLPGATTFRDDRDAHYLEKFENIYAIIEPDQGGLTLLKKLRISRIKEKVKLVFLPVKDASELWIDDPERFRERFDEALSLAIPFLNYEKERIKEQETEAWHQCKDLAQTANVLEKVCEAVHKIGVAGEEKVIKILYLAMVSRLLDRPVSVAIKGASSSGKSYILEGVAKLFPERAYYRFSAMSDRTLAFTDADLRNRMILFAEASGVASDFQSYLIRTLLSEGRIDYELVEKTKDGFRPRRIEKEGPTGFICTTTAVNLHPENETRLLSLSVDESKEQTQEVLITLAKNHDPKKNDLKKWHAFQDWLETQPKEVEIPFALELAKLIPPIAIRLRRDFKTILNLIKANAILHQVNRKRTEDGKIIADLEDYRAIYHLVNDLVSEGVEVTVPQTVREVVKAVKEITFEKEVASTKEIANFLKADRRSVDRWLKRGAALGYLRNINPGRGKKAQYTLGDAMPEDIQILPPPETLSSLPEQTWTPGQTCSNGNDQVETMQPGENTKEVSNLDTWTLGKEEIRKNKHFIATHRTYEEVVKSESVCLKRKCIICGADNWVIRKPNAKVSAIECGNCKHVELHALNKR